ncbi:Chitinase C-terminal domain-containing protein [Sulfidibacter corallicola]|uniref:Chitinase C-terminal domain-containing protein n=1 Tax=Sulfidibacter corallicola TaxID=2818388 RepID=A0A8A4U428_SULCO|nr:glycosyl hydrolase family 18 protein [Sulfidibacter corallicola]QTD53505.1 chitinase C-terminal domain-containing protein [Sulfidibacter corallicola]
MLRKALHLAHIAALFAIAWLAPITLAGDAAPQRRIVGYFTEWRNGSNGFPTFLATDIPWDRVTHLNYAFARVNEQTNRIDFSSREAAIEMTLPGQSDRYPYLGHFNVLSTMKEQYPHVKTLIAVGGWAESRGFYTMCETAAGREAFADSAVQFLRDYGFDGLDIDYEYPTATSQAGNPNDFDVSEPRRGRLYADYMELVKLLRRKLDEASAQDGKSYLLTMAAPASSWILGGMMMGEYATYMDFVNIMTYDFHGAWNGFVGHNSALLPDDRDPETRPLGVPVLNVDWAYRYFRGVIPPAKMNVGIPYYSRGWRNVNKGSLPGGLYGSAAQSGGGALGIDNIWHDLDENGQEIGSGSNPLWHLKNLVANRENLSYADDWGFDPDLGGTYERFFDDVSKVPYIWNENKRVFLSLEDEESMRHKVQYVIDKGLGGIMMWELAGDFEMGPNGEYRMGSTLTTLAHEMFQGAGPADGRMSTFPLPAETADYEIRFGGTYDHPNYTFALTLHNHGADAIDPGWKLGFSLPKTTTLTSVWGASFTKTGEHDDFQRFEITGPGWQGIPAGGSVTLQGMMKLTFSGGPRLFVLNGKASSYEVEPGNAAPVANAGMDARYEGPADVTLDGSASFDPDGDPLSYAWTQTGGPAVAIRDADQARAGFEAPEVQENTTYRFELAVNDGEFSDSDEVVITIAPKPRNQPPTANAGSDLAATAPARVALDGSASSDPDGDALQYSWQQVTGPTVVLEGANGATPSFEVASVASETQYRFELTVSDGEFEDTDAVAVTVRPASANRAPVAVVSGDQTVTAGDAVVIDASASYDPDEDALSFQWSVPAGIDPDGTTADMLRFTAPAVTADTTFTFEVQVSDGSLSDSATVDVTVRPDDGCGGPDPGDYPAWNADQIYTGGEMVSHDGKVWKALWWTRGETPGTNSVWENQSGGETWNPARAYNGGDEVNYNGRRYRAKWWTQGDNPASSNVWTDIGPATGC